MNCDELWRAGIISLNGDGEDVTGPTIHAASIGIPDTLFLMLLALVVFGPRRLPEIGRQIGKLMYEFRKVSNDFKFQMEEELRASEEADRQKKLAAAQTAALNAAPPAGVVDSEPLGTGAEEGELRALPPQIQPPATGEIVAAQRPFRSKPEDSVAEPEEELRHTADSPDAVAREAETEVHHG